MVARGIPSYRRMQRDQQRVSVFSRRLARYGMEGNFFLHKGGSVSRQRHFGSKGSSVKPMCCSIFTSVFSRECLPNSGAPPGRYRSRPIAVLDQSRAAFRGAPRSVFHDRRNSRPPSAKFSDCGLPSISIRPPVALDLWPYVSEPQYNAFTTVSSWWADESISDGTEVYDNTKRAQFLEFAGLPRMTSQRLELALKSAGKADVEDCGCC